MTPTTILDFWFTELTTEDRFSGGERVDALISERFAAVHKAVAANECAAWRATPEGSLAEIIVLDQFSRNLYRAQPEAFAFDGHALALAQVAIEKGFVEKVSDEQKLFLYMPFMHSESKVIHATALELFTALGNEASLKYEQLHKDIIDQFGRYPHRNQQLGRESTSEEEVYLADTKLNFFAS